MTWKNNVDQLLLNLNSLATWDQQKNALEINQAFKKWVAFTTQIYQNKKTVYLIGNGASASMASHVAADLAKNAKLHTEVFSDLSLITAIANDLSYEDVFSEPLARRMDSNDMLVAISSSGNSPNIIKAINTARRFKATVVTLSAMNQDNAICNMGNLNFFVNAKTYGMAETCHAAILHYWIDQMV